MHVTVDRAGRIVIPKSLRLALGIGPATELELIPDGAGLRLEPVRRASREIEERDGLPLLGPVEGIVLTDDHVRRLRTASSAEARRATPPRHRQPPARCSSE